MINNQVQSSSSPSMMIIINSRLIDHQYQIIIDWRLIMKFNTQSSLTEEWSWWSIPKCNPLMKSNILNTSCNSHCRHHHHVCPIEVFLNSANHTHDYDHISHHWHVCWSLSSYQWWCFYADVYDVYATGKRSSLLKGKSCESQCLYTYESLIWPLVTLKSVTVSTS